MHAQSVRNQIRPILISFVAAGALLGAASLPAQNLLLNGDFETPVITEPYKAYAPGLNLGGWTVEYHSVDIVRGYWQPARGFQSLDLTGVQPGGIYQDIATVHDQSYTLSFAMAGNPEYAALRTMEIWWGSSKLDTLTVDTTGRSFSDMGWAYHQYIVTGSGTDRLRFRALGYPESYGPTLDDVSLVAVPEPGCLALLAICSATALLRKRAN